jgi:hypothetical protein
MTEAQVFERLRRDYPFLTYVKYGETEIVGVIQNLTSQFLMIFDYAEIKTDVDKKLFLELGERWWYESNTKVPIDVFLGEKFEGFRHVLRGYSRREVKDIIGPTINLAEMFARRVKKRRVEFMKQG